MKLPCKGYSFLTFPPALLAFLALSSLLHLAPAKATFHALHRAHHKSVYTLCHSLPSENAVGLPGSSSYLAFMKRFMASSAQWPTCVWKPTRPADLSHGVKLIGASGVPFAISGGRHTSNPGFSSTTGIQIDLTGFKQVKLSADGSYVDIGGGCLWDDVYESLSVASAANGEKNVVGGRVSGVGVGGFITNGGGYSWKTSQYGLTVDTLIQVDMVLPNGTLTTANQRDNADLFAAVKGGGNQFGIVYNFRLETHPQPELIFGGMRVYPPTASSAVLEAIAKFSAQNTDAKAQIVATLTHTGATLPTLGKAKQSGMIVLLAFYDDPEAPADTFKMFEGIASVVDTWKKQTFRSFIHGLPAERQAGQRGLFHSLSVQELTKPLLEEISHELSSLAKVAFSEGRSISLMTYNVQPFAKYGRMAKKERPSMYQHDESPLPINMYFAWEDPADDDYYRRIALESAHRLTGKAKAQGQDLDGIHLYPNYCLASTPAVKIFGATGMAKLLAAKGAYDPTNIMGRGTTYFSFSP